MNEQNTPETTTPDEPLQIIVPPTQIEDGFTPKRIIALIAAALVIVLTVLGLIRLFTSAPADVIEEPHMTVVPPSPTIYEVPLGGARIDVLIEPQFYGLRPFYEGLAAAIWYNYTLLWGYIDINGDWIIEPQFTSVFGFSEGFAFVAIGQHTSREWGVIDMQGNWVIEPRFLWGSYFEGGIAVISCRERRRHGIIDMNGNYIAEPDVFTIIQPFNGYEITPAFVNEDGFANTPGVWHLINRQGEIVVENVFIGVGNISSFQEGLAFFRDRDLREDNGYGAIDINGNIVIQPQFTTMGQIYPSGPSLSRNGFVNGRAIVRKDDEYAMIDERGNVIVDFTDNRFSGIVGERVVFGQHSECYIEHIGMDVLHIPQSGVWGVMALNGNIVVERRLEYYRIFLLSDGNLLTMTGCLHEGGYLGMRNTEGKLMVANALSVFSIEGRGTEQDTFIFIIEDEENRWGVLYGLLRIEIDT